jgi:hypothetical protein
MAWVTRLWSVITAGSWEAGLGMVVGLGERQAASLGAPGETRLTPDRPA